MTTGSTTLPGGRYFPSSPRVVLKAMRSARPIRATSSRSWVGRVVREIAVPATIPATGSITRSITSRLRQRCRAISRRATRASARIDEPVTRCSSRYADRRQAESPG